MGKIPIEFLENADEKHGPIFSVTMADKMFNYLLRGDAATLFFNHKNKDLNTRVTTVI